MRDTDRQILAQVITSRIQRLNLILTSGEVIDKQIKKEQEYDESVRLDNLSQEPVDANLFVLAEQELNQLKANLNWLECDDAGICEECGVDIPIRRLMAVPTTRRCVNCASDH